MVAKPAEWHVPTAAALDAAVFWTALVLLGLMPLAVPGFERSKSLAALLLSASMMVCLALRAALSPEPLVRTWACLPAGLFILLVVMQLVPLPVAVVGAISPGTLAAKSAPISGEGGQLRSVALSLFPAATLQGLQRLLAAAAVFAGVANTCSDPARVRRLLSVVCSIGGLVAIMDLVQHLAGDTLAGVVAPAQGGRAQFMNLSLGATFALAFVVLHEGFRTARFTFARFIEHLGSGLRPLWRLTGIGIILGASVFMSFNRAGMLAMLLAACLTVVMLIVGRGLSRRNWQITVTALLAVAIVLYTGFASLRERGRFQAPPAADAGQLVRELTDSLRKYPLAGSGLGSHLADPRGGPRSGAYGTAIRETGLAGLALLLAFAGLVWRELVRAVGTGRSSGRMAAFGIGFSIVAATAQSLGDAELLLPANMTLLAGLCGLLAGLARAGGGASKGVA